MIKAYVCQIVLKYFSIIIILAQIVVLFVMKPNDYYY